MRKKTLKLKFDYSMPENLNDIKMSRPTSFTNEKEKQEFREVTKEMTGAEVKYMCSYMWRLGYATAIKETGSEIPAHRKSDGEKQRVN